MRKLYLSIFTLLLIVSNLAFYSFTMNFQCNEALFNRPEVVLKYKSLDKCPPKSIQDVLVEFSKKNSINLIQCYYTDNYNVELVSTNIDSDPLKEKLLNFPGNKWHVTNSGFENIPNIGIGNRFYISTNDVEVINKLDKAVSSYAKLYVELPRILIISSMDWISVMLVTLVLLLHYICTLFYVRTHTKEIAIRSIFKEERWQACFECLKNDLFLTQGLTLLAAITEIIVLEQFQLLSSMLGLVTVVFLNQATWLLVNTLSLRFLYKESQISSEKSLMEKQEESFFVFTLMVKILATLSLFVVLVATANHMNEYKRQLSGLDSWDKTKPAYRIMIGNLLELTVDNLGNDRDYNNRALAFYNMLEAQKKGFIIDSRNFLRIESENESIQYQYTLDTENENALFLPEGRRITISESYLKYNPIQAQNSADKVEKKLIHQDNTLNLLVPMKLKIHEKDILKAYLDWFYFYKVDVDNMYNKELNMPMNRTQKKDLKINLIYVADNQKYFTYNDSTGDHHGFVHDPIAVVYNESVDTSCMGSIATHSMYFLDSSGNQAFNNISGIMEVTDFKEVLATVSVYSEKALDIARLKDRIVKNTILSIFTVVLLLLYSTMYFLLLYQLLKKELYIQYVFGAGINHKLYGILYFDVLVAVIAIITQMNAATVLKVVVVLLSLFLIAIDLINLFGITKKIQSMRYLTRER